MRELSSFADVHSHVRCGNDVITNLELFAIPGDGWYSAGIHPWELSKIIEEGRLEDAWQWVENVAASDRVVAIGETGLDGRHAPLVPWEAQTQVFVRHIDLANRLGKPLIVHCVGAWKRLIDLAPAIRVPAVVHGFRGKPELARQLLAAGFDLSFGARCNPASYAATPLSRRHRETDTAPQP